MTPSIQANCIALTTAGETRGTEMLSNLCFIVLVHLSFQQKLCLVWTFSQWVYRIEHVEPQGSNKEYTYKWCSARIGVWKMSRLSPRWYRRVLSACLNHRRDPNPRLQIVVDVIPTFLTCILSWSFQRARRALCSRAVSYIYTQVTTDVWFANARMSTHAGPASHAVRSSCNFCIVHIKRYRNRIDVRFMCVCPRVVICRAWDV